jgi:hypothetical protein
MCAEMRPARFAQVAARATPVSPAALSKESAAPRRRSLPLRRTCYLIWEETGVVTVWNYRKIDLSEQRPRSDELDLLNTAGADGWELVGITSNNIAYLKRPIEDTVHASSVHSAEATRPADAENVNGAVHQLERAYVQPKYRDPTTNQTWSGRGRMANWLKRKQETGEDIEKYLV